MKWFRGNVLYMRGLGRKRPTAADLKCLLSPLLTEHGKIFTVLHDIIRSNIIRLFGIIRRHITLLLVTIRSNITDYLVSIEVKSLDGLSRLRCVAGHTQIN
jgi:hypothetical protein